MKSLNRFTLIELLIVVAILGILISILIPSLSRAKETAKMAVCASNMNQLSKAYLAYSSNNDNKLLSAASSAINDIPPWIVHSEWDFDRNVLESPMWPYLKNKDVFRCPNENRQNVLDNGNYKRTYSINFNLNGFEGVMDNQERINSMYKVESIADTFLFIGEEDPRGSNVNAFNVGSSSIWVDWPANNHGVKKTTVNYLDGHCQIYKFKNQSTSQITGFWSQDGADDRREFLRMSTPAIA